MNSTFSVLFTIMLFTTLFVECGSINQSEPAEPAAIPTVTGLPDQPEEIDNDIPDAYPAPTENQPEIETQSYPAPTEDQPEIETQSYPAPTLQNTPNPYPSEPELPTPYPEPES